jgi:hypothetical protein
MSKEVEIGDLVEISDDFYVFGLKTLIGIVVKIETKEEMDQTRGTYEPWYLVLFPEGYIHGFDRDEFELLEGKNESQK